MEKAIIKEVYISIDIEADGPIPGEYSMTSLGASASGYMTSTGEIVNLDTSLPENRFYVEIKPISPLYVPEAFNVGLFTGFTGTDLEAKRAYIEAEGEEPEVAMDKFEAWVSGTIKAHGARAAIFAAYPLGFDWMWTYWYLMKFAKNGSPFGHSRHIDIKTLYAARAKSMISRSIKQNIPASLKPKTKHTHMALDDAIEQGELLMNVLRWEKPNS